MTNHWVDIKNTDLVLIMGGNAAEAHPCGFKWVTEAKAHRKARLIMLDPRFTRSAAQRGLQVPGIGRIADGALWLALRCLSEADEADFRGQLAQLAA